MFGILENLTRLSNNLLSKLQADKLFDEAKALYEAREYRNALALMKESAEKGNPHAMAHLGVMCLKGQGTPTDWVKAAELFNMTLKLQDYQGIEFSRAVLKSNLGLIYGLGGYGLKRDREKAIATLREAVNEGDTRSAEALKMVIGKKGAFGQKEQAKPDIKW